MKRELHVRFCEGLRVRIPRATRRKTSAPREEAGGLRTWGEMAIIKMTAAVAVCETNVSLKNINETMLSLEMRADPSNRYAGTDSNHLKLQWLNAICGER
jgi:hypothetical protein